MLDLRKYTKLCQIGDTIDYLNNLKQAGKLDKQSSAYEGLQELMKQYNELRQNMGMDYIKNNDVEVNLQQLLNNLIKVLNSCTADADWHYDYKELEHKTFQEEHNGYGMHEYHTYKYQAVLVAGDKEVPVCTVHRPLLYGNDNATVNFLLDEMHAPFNLRLDELGESFDFETSKLLKRASVKTLLQNNKTARQEEISLIQQRIVELSEEVAEDRRDIRQIDKQIEILDEAINK